MSMTRNDYGTAAIVPVNNSVIKRISALNAPYSIQATGGDLLPIQANGAASKLVAITEDVLDAQADAGTLVNTRVIYGNQQGYIKSQVINAGPPVTLTSAVFTFRDKDNNEVDQTLTTAEILASGEFFLLQP